MIVEEVIKTDYFLSLSGTLCLAPSRYFTLVCQLYILCSGHLGKQWTGAKLNTVLFEGMNSGEWYGVSGSVYLLFAVEVASGLKNRNHDLV